MGFDTKNEVMTNHREEFTLKDIVRPGIGSDVSMYIYALRTQEFYAQEEEDAKRDGHDLLAVHYESLGRQMGRVLERGERRYRVTPWLRQGVVQTAKAASELGRDMHRSVNNLLYSGFERAEEFAKELLEAWEPPSDVVE
jgi:hypothetical protein